MLYKVMMLVLVSTVKSSRVVDSAGQKGILLSEYCPKSAHCPEGSHVMCMYFNPIKKMGPQCRNARNVTMTAEIANVLLDVSNAVRSKIARGHERGQDNIPLPRGYGIFRLKWDPMLATFAQVLANQCTLKHDQCRGTKKFPNPGQVTGAVRFIGPDWTTKKNLGNFTEKGFNKGKVLYAATQVLKSWYRQKSSVNITVLNNYPDWELMQGNLMGKLYMEMIYGPSTHMGCGVSAYTEYAYYDDNQPLYYNTILIICNFSARPLAGGAVYNTVPPGDPTVLNPSGCPAGSVDDDDSLCHEELKEPYDSHKAVGSCLSGSQCDPTVVLLPIFTVEDAPLDKLITDDRKMINVSHGNRKFITDSLEIFDNSLPEFQHTLHTKSKITEDSITHSGKYPVSHRKRNTEKNKQIIKSRHFGPNQNKIVDRVQQNIEPRKQVHHISRPSFFSKTPRFELPGAQDFTSIANRGNVFSRKDLSGSTQLVDKYPKENMVLPVKRDKTVNGHKMLTDFNELKPQEVIAHKKEKHILQNPLLHDIEPNKELTDDTGFGLDTVEHLISENEYVENKFNKHSKTPKVESVTEETDNKLMALLDTLEQEVKHIELREDEKQVFDAKIRKIYGKVVGKPVENIMGDLGNKRQVHELIDEYHTPKNDLVVDKKRMSDRNLNEEHNDERYNGHRKAQPDAQKENSNNYESYINDYSPQFRRFDQSERNVFNTNIPLVGHRIVDTTNKSYRKRNENSLRPSNKNDLHSNDRVFNARQRNYGNSREYDRKSQRRDLLQRDSSRKNVGSGNIRSDDFKGIRNSYNEFQAEDPLSIDRRKYYQDKLDNIQKNLKNVRRNRKKERPAHLRAMLPNSRSVNQMESLYMPGRARILHSY